MPAYEFRHDLAVKNEQFADLPFQLNELPAGRQLSHAEGGRNRFNGTGYLEYQEDIEEFLMPGFRALDESMKLYFSGIRIPTKDGYKFMRVKISGMDKSLMIWASELKEKRAVLPVAGISRESYNFNADKFSPAYHLMTARYVSSRGDQIAQIFRPVPYLVEYTMTIWAASKRDAEYASMQISTRFNPLAEFRLFDGKLRGYIQLRYGGTVDTSDKEMGADQRAQVRYEIKMTAEAWLPLPEKITKTILGTVKSLQEFDGTLL